MSKFPLKTLSLLLVGGPLSACSVQLPSGTVGTLKELAQSSLAQLQVSAPTEVALPEDAGEGQGLLGAPQGMPGATPALRAFSATGLVPRFSPRATDLAIQEPELLGGALAVKSVLLDGLKDPKRGGRELPLKLYYPSRGVEACPVVIFSHGGPGHDSSREAYGYLGAYLASRGFVAIHLQHQLDAERPFTYDRPMDVRFLLDQLERTHGQLRGLPVRLKLDRIGMAGHSFGAFTTLALAGAKVDLPLRWGGPNVRFTEPRLQAFMALSPQGAGQFGLDANSWRGIQAPVCEMMGALELDTRLGDLAPAPRPWWRLESWLGLPATGNKHLAVLPGAQHSDFNDRLAPTPTALATQAFVKTNAALFFRCYLSAMPKLEPWIGKLAKPEGTRLEAK